MKNVLITATTIWSAITIRGSKKIIIKGSEGKDHCQNQQMVLNVIFKTRAWVLYQHLKTRVAAEVQILDADKAQNVF